MDPRAVVRPVGPEPPGVYWRRRVVLLVVVAVVVAVVAWGCAGGSATPTTTAGSSAPPSSPSPTATSPSPAGPAPCRRAALTVTASTDATSYPAGAVPRLSATVTNVGDRPCRLDSSPSARTWTVMSGSDRIWSTADCPQSHLAATTLLRRGRSVRYLVTWDRHRSTHGCAAPGAAAKPGTYRLYVTVDRITSAAAVFHLA